MGHWHVIESTPGYMPDSEPACFRSKERAEAHARELAAELRESGYRVSGNARDGYEAYRRDAVMADLGRVVEVVEMPGPPCSDAAD